LAPSRDPEPNNSGANEKSKREMADEKPREVFMKGSKLMMSVAFLLFVSLAPAFAQTATVRVSLPFDFNVGQQTLTAGEYRVIVDRTTLRVAPMNAQGIDCGSFTYLSAGPSQDVSPKLVFHRYGNRYFLSEVWTGDVKRGHKLMASTTEREYARAASPASTSVLATRLSN
jgi:hypothetical protein